MSKDILKEVEMKPLYGLTSKSKTKVWKVTIIAYEAGNAEIKQEYGMLDGKMQINIKNIKKGKNLGKVNETSPFHQASLEAASKYRKKLEQEGYSEDKDNLKIPELPMLAQTYDYEKDKIVFPAFAQPKLNGVRNFEKQIAPGTIQYKSRKGKEYTTLEHLTSDLLKIPEIKIGDGEVYCHGMSLQEIGKAVKKQREASLDLELWLYDIADPDMDFEDRIVKLHNAIAKLPKDSKIKAVETVEVNSEEEIMALHKKWIDEGFEGIIIRNKKGGYSFKHRSKNLQKYKDFMDDEFQIVGGYEGNGTSYEGMVTFECITKEGKIFGVVPKGSHAYKRELWQDLDKILAAKTMLTVKFLEYSDEGLPIGNTVGIAIRDYE